RRTGSPPPGPKRSARASPRWFAPAAPRARTRSTRSGPRWSAARSPGPAAEVIEAALLERGHLAVLPAERQVRTAGERFDPTDPIKTREHIAWGENGQQRVVLAAVQREGEGIQPCLRGSGLERRARDRGRVDHGPHASRARHVAQIAG